MGKGTSTSSSSQTSQATPWAPTQDSLNGILGGINGLLPQAGLNGAQSGALNTIEGNAGRATPLGNQAINVAGGLLNGGGAQANDASMRSNLSNYQGILSPYANGSMIGNNSALKAQLDTAASDITNQINSQWAAAGRDGSPGNTQALARGIMQAQAPILANQYNQDVSNQLNAANSLYGAGNTTAGLLNQSQQTANANAAGGIDTSNNALGLLNYAPNTILGAESQRFNLPASNYQTLLGSVSPVAQAFGTNTSSGQGTQTMSPLQQMLAYTQMAGNLGKAWGSVFGGGV